MVILVEMVKAPEGLVNDCIDDALCLFCNYILFFSSPFYLSYSLR